MTKQVSHAFVCDACGTRLVSTWSQADAEAEYRERFGTVPLSESGVVCDDCYYIVTTPVDRRA